MEKWKLYAFAAAFFAGVTSILAKAGLQGLSADLGLAVRSAFVLGFVLLNLVAWSSGASQISALREAGGKTLALLALSALATTLSWICYYRAMKEGTVTFVSLVDKGSLLVTLVLSFLVLGEPLTWRLALGAILILAGIFIVAGGK